MAVVNELDAWSNTSRAARTSARSSEITASSRTTSAASGSGDRPQVVQPRTSSATAPHLGQAYDLPPLVTGAPPYELVMQ